VGIAHRIAVHLPAHTDVELITIDDDHDLI
jgi:hypothetical protein